MQEMCVKGIVFPKTTPIVLSHPTTARDWRIPEVGRATMAERTAHGGTQRSATLGKVETQKLCDGTTENTEWPRESTAETFISFYCCKAKPKELESCAFQTINCTCTISLCNLLPQESVAGGFIRTQKGSGPRVPGVPGTAVAMVWKRQEPSCPRASASPAPRGCAGDHPGLGLANCACSGTPRTSCHRRQGTLLKIMRFGGLSQLPRFVRAMTV